MIFGHKSLVKIFKTLSDNGQLAHAYLFFGPEGVGKKTFALALAAYLETGDFNFRSDRVLGDSILVSLKDKRTIGIDEVRALKAFLYLRPNVSSKRVAIIDDADALTIEAQNALLKTAEEPPDSSVLILVARDPGGLSYTLASRLQRIYFKGFSEPELLKAVKSKIEGGEFNKNKIPEKQIEEAARLAGGSLGLALKILGADDFHELYTKAERLLKLEGSQRKKFIKALTEEDEFNFFDFIDAIIMVLINDFRRKRGMNFVLWHKMLRLRQDISNFPLNPRLQIEALFDKI